MSFSDLKISEATIQSTGVQSQPDTLTGSAPDNKLVFDALPTLIIQKLNSLLDLLGGTGAAGEMPIAPIDGMTATTVQQALAELRQALTAYINLVQGTTGAAQVGVSAISGMQAQNAQAALGELKALIDNLVIGALPPGSVTADMIADGAIVQLGALLAVAAAAAYDPEGSYAVGDYCTYQGLLHKCNTAIPSGEPWTAEHWTETTVVAELAEVRASLSNKVSDVITLRTVDLDDIVDTGFYNYDTTTEILNAPAGNNGFLIVIGSGTAPSVYCKQVWFREGTANVNDFDTYVRTRATISGEIAWSRWRKYSIGMPPQVRNLTLQSGFTADGDCTFFVTQESAVFLAGGVSGTLSANQDTQIGTLPADACPAAQRRRPAVTNNGSAYIDIHTDGTVWAHPFAAATQCWFDCSFVAEGGA